MSAGDPAERRYARSASITAVLQVGTMLAGGLLAVVVSHLFGRGPAVDGLFAAYAVYTLLLALAQTLRTAIVAKLTEGPLWEELDRLAGAVLVLGALVAVPLVALSRPLAVLLTGDLGDAAADAAQSALVLLWAAALAQLLAALSAAALAVEEEFALPGIAYFGGGLLALVVAFALEEPLGTDAVAAGVAIGSGVTLTVLVARLVMRGWRPLGSRIRPGRGTLGRMATVLLGSVSSIVGQISFLVTIGFAARLGEGAVTAYSYAFFAAALLMGATSLPAGIVMAAPISEDWDRRPASLRTDTLAVARFGFILIAPALAAAAAFGQPLVETVLGEAVNSSDAAAIVNTFLILGLPMAAPLAVAVPVLAAFAAGRYRAVAVASLASGVVHVAATGCAAVLTDGIEGLAAAGVVSSLTWVVLVYLTALGDEAGRMLAAMAREVVVVAAIAGAAFGPTVAAGLALGDGWPAGAAGWIAGLAIFVAILSRSHAHWDLVRRALPGGLRVVSAGKSQAPLHG